MGITRDCIRDALRLENPNTETINQAATVGACRRPASDTCPALEQRGREDYFADRYRAVLTAA